METLIKSLENNVTRGKLCYADMEPSDRQENIEWPSKALQTGTGSTILFSNHDQSHTMYLSTKMSSQDIYLFIHGTKLSPSSFCGTADSVVTSDTGGPSVESSHRHFLLNNSADY